MDSLMFKSAADGCRLNVLLINSWRSWTVVLDYAYDLGDSTRESIAFKLLPVYTYRSLLSLRLTFLLPNGLI